MPFSVKHGGCHCPTWKGTLTVVLVCIALMGSFVGWSWYVHTRKNVFEIKALEERIDMRLEAHRQTMVDLLVRLEDRIDSLASKIPEYND